MRTSRLAAVLVAGVLMLLLAAPAMAQQIDRRGVSAAAPNPLVGEKWFVDPQEPAFKSYRGYQGANRDLMAKIALTPRFKWFGRFSRPTAGSIRSFISRASADGAVPLVATLRHQGKQCNPRYTAGGKREDRSTKRWFKDFARGIGKSRVIIAFEPDSVGTIECLARSRRKARVAVLRYGIDQLAKLPNATVYIEATAADWKSVSYVAKVLRQIGVAKVRGFMVNVTHYEWTGANIRYGRKLSKRLGGKHFVISTAMNGRGTVRYRRGKRPVNVLCHPLYRGAGPYPTTKTSDPLVDAYFWINRAGYSGGRCNGGPLPVGSWWPERALMFARHQSNQEGPPPNSTFGFTGSPYSLRQVAGDQLRR